MWLGDMKHVLVGIATIRQVLFFCFCSFTVLGTDRSLLSLAVLRTQHATQLSIINLVFNWTFTFIIPRELSGVVVVGGTIIQATGRRALV